MSHQLRNIADLLVNAVGATSKSKAKQLKEQKKQALEEYGHDIKYNESFPMLFDEIADRPALIDVEDGVRRCARCHWELHGNVCDHCNWQDASRDSVGSHLDEEGVDLDRDSDDYSDNEDVPIVFEEDLSFVVPDDEVDWEVNSDDEERESYNSDELDVILTDHFADHARRSRGTVHEEEEEEEQEEEEEEEGVEEEEEEDDELPVIRRLRGTNGRNQPSLVVIGSSDSDNNAENDHNRRGNNRILAYSSDSSMEEVR